MNDIGIDYKKFFDGRNGESIGAVVLITDNQVIERLNSDDGRGAHDTNVDEIVEFICFSDEEEIERNKTEKEVYKTFDKLDKIFKFYSDNIRIKLVSDVDFGYYSIAIFFPSDGWLSIGQYEMLSNWCEERGHLIKDILASIGFEYGEEEDSLIHCDIVGKDFYMNDLMDVVEFFKRGIDYDKVPLQEKVIIGKTYARKRWNRMGW